MHTHPPTEAHEADLPAANLLLDIGTALLASGAHCGRITRNIERIADAWGYRADALITFTGILLTITPLDRPDTQIKRYRSCMHHGARFDTITSVSLLSWRVVEQGLTVEDTAREFSAAATGTPHPPWLLLPGVGLACASLCVLAGGDWPNAVSAFAATLLGMLVRMALLHHRFHPMISVIAAAFTTTLVAGAGHFFVHHYNAEAAIATSVLYLIPGVQLVNCTIDLIEGHVHTALARALLGAFILLSMSVGMSLALPLLHIKLF